VGGYHSIRHLLGAIRYRVNRGEDHDSENQGSGQKPRAAEQGAEEGIQPTVSLSQLAIGRMAGIKRKMPHSKPQ